MLLKINRYNYLFTCLSLLLLYNNFIQVFYNVQEKLYTQNKYKYIIILYKNNSI